MLDRMPNPDTPRLRLDLLDFPPDLSNDQIDRAQRILAQVLTYLRAQSRKLPPEADLALTYDLQTEAGRR